MVQRAIESRGIPTVSPTVALDISEHAKPPRALFLPFRMGHQFGVPFHVQLQMEIVMACLDLFSQTSDSWILERFPKTWAQARREFPGNAS